MGVLGEMLGEGVYLWMAGGCRAGERLPRACFGVFSWEKGFCSVRFSVDGACRPAAPDARTPTGILPQSGKCLTRRISASGGRW